MTLKALLMKNKAYNQDAFLKKQVWNIILLKKQYWSYKFTYRWFK